VHLAACRQRVAQFQTGNIYGKVSGKGRKARYPVVTVNLTGRWAPQSQQSDAQGNFSIHQFVASAYTLKAELAGYGTSTRAGIGVNVDAMPT